MATIIPQYTVLYLHQIYVVIIKMKQNFQIAICDL